MIIMLKRFRTFVTLLLVFGLSAVLMGDAAETTQYFPETLGSYWVYEDQDGNELTRRVVEGKEIAEEMYHAFNYEPALEDSANYDYHIHPNFYKIGEEQMTFLVGEEAQKAIKARFTKEMETFIKMGKQMDPNINILYQVKVEIQDPFYVLPTSVNINEAWEATQIKAKITMTPFPPQDPEKIIVEFTIVETGKVLGTEKVETPAGTFENCLKIEYRTETGVTTDPPQDENPPGESVTTLWVAPNVGMVKFHQKTEDILLKVVPLPEPTDSTMIKTLELKKYEVKSAD